MTRRSFLAAAASAFTLDPERALWIRGAKTISIPAPRVFDSGVAIWVGQLGTWIPTEGCNCMRCVYKRGVVPRMWGHTYYLDQFAEVSA